MNKKSLTVALIACLGLGGCATTTEDAYTGEEKTSKATQGAVIGGVIGALGGILTGNGKDNGKRALVGGLLGAGVGGAVGNYMDQQEAELRRSLRNSGVSVTRVGNQIILNMPGNITFATNSHRISPSFNRVLDSVAEVLRKFKDTQIEVSGHTDSQGPDQVNEALSQRRAESVATFLSEQGIAWSRMRAIGYGESVPIASNDTEEGRAQNRRVEISILPTSQG